MKTQYGGAVTRTRFPQVQEPKGSGYLDKLANEIFDLLNDENCAPSIEDLQLRLTLAANLLVRSAGPSEAEMQAALRGLSSKQLQVLFQHLDGMTCEQIAEREGRAQEAILNDLTSAYVRLRFSLDWTGGPDAQTSQGSAAPDETDEKS